MVNQEVVKYIQSSLAKGLSVNEIKKNLISNGWEEFEVNEAINSVMPGKSSGESASAPPKKMWLIIGIIVVLLGVSSATYFLFFAGEDTQTQTCAELSGDICLTGEECAGTGTYLSAASDSSYCCSVDCTPVCTASWNCLNYTCVNGTNSRLCTDSSNCEESKTQILAANWTWTNWTDCVNGNQTKTGTDRNACASPKNETRACTSNIINCSAGNGCNLNCVNLGGDKDCTCEAQGASIFENITLFLVSSGKVCNGTVVLSSNDTYYNINRICCIGNAVIPTCGNDGFCKILGCQDTGDTDCTCEEQNWILKGGADPVSACEKGSFVRRSSDTNTEGGIFCCTPNPKDPNPRIP